MLTLAGEQSAYEILVKRYQSAVVSSALSITKSRFMAEDTAQDAFVTAWMKLNTLQEPKKYGSWVCRISKNCALNMISRYRSFLPLDVVDNLNITADAAENPAELYALSEDRNEVAKTVDSLPEKVRQIIQLHYFEDLSIAEIADRMRISAGTVKWHLHDGRKRIRKELCAMNEKYSDTLVQRVMKKVEELKLWQVKNDKSGFEKVYKEVLSEVEELPEYKEKQHALADVLMRGWWWLPGKKNDALFARIADAATEGKNEEVMTFIVAREDSKVYGGARIEFMRDKQIPRLEKAGFVKALGREWFWLGYNLFRAGKAEEGDAAYNKVEEILTEKDSYRVLVPYARKLENALLGDYKDKNPKNYIIGATAEEYRYIDGTLRHWSEEHVGNGYTCSVDRQIMHIFRNSSRCDGRFFADISIGETYTGSDGTTLSYVSSTETVDTPAGKFDNCQLWVTKVLGDNGKSVYKSYYKEGIGVVKFEHINDGISDTRLLKSYDVKKGVGLLPFDTGNTWEYASEYDPKFIISDLKYTVSFANNEKVILSSWESVYRLGYNDESWEDMIAMIRNDYWEEKDEMLRLCDITPAIEQAEALAVTPMQKAHTKAAASTARRILETDPVFNPEHTAIGHWNFFTKDLIQNKNGTLRRTFNFRWSFEWKNTGYVHGAEYPILCNDILGLLQDAANCIWSDEWRVGASPIVEYDWWDCPIKSQITCEDGGKITTKAGTFENCLKLCIDIEGFDDGLSYRGGKKRYYFADGIGIVRTENEYCGGSRTAVYELTSYVGKGEGFMPIADGLMRRYDAVELTDGFIGAVEYAYVADDDGDVFIFADRIGIRVLPPPITQYSSIQGELIEQQLCDSGKWKEGQIKYGANSFHLLLHLIARPSHNIYDAKRSIEINGFYMKLMELLGENGEVPPAWYGIYVWSAVVRAAALFGDGRNDEGYSSLDICLNYCEKIKNLKPGDNLDIGNAEVFKGVKYEYTKSVIILPDGSREPASFDYKMEFGFSNLVSCLTAQSGWEWFDSVRNEERFKEIVQRAKNAIADK